MDLKLYEPESFVAKPITTQYSQKSRNSFCRRGLGLRIGGSRFVSYRQKHASVSVTPKLPTGIIINTNRHGYTIGRASDLQFTGRGFKLRGAPLLSGLGAFVSGWRAQLDWRGGITASTTVRFLSNRKPYGGICFCWSTCCFIPLIIIIVIIINSIIIKFQLYTDTVLGVLTMAITGIKTPRLPALLDACKHHTAVKRSNRQKQHSALHCYHLMSFCTDLLLVNMCICHRAINLLTYL